MERKSRKYIVTDKFITNLYKSGLRDGLELSNMSKKDIKVYIDQTTLNLSDIKHLEVSEDL